MKIGKLYIKNIKAVREITVYGADLMELAGPNEAGKSSFWDGLRYAICGKGAIGELPLRRGKKKGEATVYLVHDENECSFEEIDTEEKADLIVTRKFNEKNQHNGGSLTIRARDGSKWGQTMLSDIYDATMFSPPDIASRLPGESKSDFDKRVAETFRQLAGEEFCEELEVKDAAIKATKEERTLVNRELKRMGKLEEVEETKEIDISKVTAELQAVEQFNSEQMNLQNAVDNLQRDIAKNKEQIKALEKQLKNCKIYLKDQMAELEKMPKPDSLKNTNPLHTKIAEAGATNRRAQEYQEYLKALETVQGKTKESLSLDRQVERLDDERQELIQGIELGIPGLEWDGAGISLKGIPWSELSTGQRWCASIDIVIQQQSIKPGRRLKAILIREGGLIDKGNFEKIVKRANEKGWQICAESVMPHSGDAIMIENGEINEDESPL